MDGTTYHHKRRSNISSHTNVRKLALFLVLGVPTCVVAVALNYVLVKIACMPMMLAYAVVMACQAAINFFLCIRYVFKRDLRKSLASRFVLFLSGMIVFRLADWALYSAITRADVAYFLLVQVFNTGVFSLLKFFYFRWAIEGRDNE